MGPCAATPGTKPAPWVKRYLTALPTGLSRKDRKKICNYGQSYGE